jgi:hypothetical protein
MQIESETHEKNNRAGFSVIVLDQNAKGIEISFWENEIWVQGDDQTGGLFRHSEGAAFATTASMTEYQVTILGDSYTLFANSVQLLNGPMRDYSSFSGFPDPYETPNLLFMGDDTTSSQARVKLKFVSVTGKEPVVPTATHASTSAATALGTVTSTPPALAATPPLTPARTSRGVELCPAGWLSGAVMIFSATTMKIIRWRGKRL